MRRWLVAGGVGLVLLLAGCGGGDDPTAGLLAEEPAEDFFGDQEEYQPPPCPFEADSISALLGVELTDRGGCSFSNGVELVGINQSSQLAGATTYDYQRDLAEQTYDQVSDLGLGETSFWAVKDIGAEAVVVSADGSYTVTMSSFSLDPAGYEQALRALLDVAMS